MERHVRIGNDVFLYGHKAPYSSSGYSLQGVLELDEADDRVKCHECGEWCERLGNHVWLVHGMKARDYKVKHGLPLYAALLGERLRNLHVELGSKPELQAASIRAIQAAGIDMRAVGKLGAGKRSAGRRGLMHATRNRNRTCPQQILERIREIAAKVGRPVGLRDLVANGLHPKSIEAVHGTTWRNAVRLAGIDPEVLVRYSRPTLVELLRDFYVKYHRLPSESDQHRGVIPSADTFRKAFGGMMEAYEAAGLRQVAEERLRDNVARIAPKPMYSAAELERRLRSFVYSHHRLPTKQEGDSGSCGLPTYKTYSRYFPSVSALRRRIAREMLVVPG